jgi:hypothetical protein
MKKLRRSHVPREALGVGYEEWAAQFLAELEEQSPKPQPQRPQPPLGASFFSRPQGAEPRSALVPILVLLIILCMSFFLAPDGGEKLTAEEIMAHALR